MGLSLALFISLASLTAGCRKTADLNSEDPDRVKIGFLIKQPDSAWFQYEWKFARQAGTEHGFDVITIGATDGEKVLAAIDNLAASGAQGFVICPPDTRLGPGIMAKARLNNLKVIAVDDQFLGADGKPMANVPYIGIAATKIGEDVGVALLDEMKRRGWSPADTAISAVTQDQLTTTKQRTDASIRKLIALGYPESQIHRAPVRSADIPGAFEAMNSVLAKSPNVKHWQRQRRVGRGAGSRRPRLPGRELRRHRHRRHRLHSRTGKGQRHFVLRLHAAANPSAQLRRRPPSLPLDQRRRRTSARYPHVRRAHHPR